MKKCAKCGDYVLVQCPCGGKTVNPEPPSWSEDDRYWRKRLKAKGIEI